VAKVLTGVHKARPYPSPRIAHPDRVGARLDRARETRDKPRVPELPQRATERLYLGRESLAGAVYFVTLVTAKRIPWLAPRSARAAMIETWRNWHSEADGSILAATVMPDHVHVLFTLGARLDLGRCVSRWKSRARKRAGYPGEWQRDFWEHRVRSDEPWEDYGLYIFLNPYRAHLLPGDVAWCGTWLPNPGQFRFCSSLGAKGEPPREWLNWSDEKFSCLATGE
jgi:REP element-mobilizing transposase RayT